MSYFERCERLHVEEMTADIRKVNEEHGWREGTNTFGDYLALLHSEISEALEAYRDHGVADATEVVAECYPVGDMCTTHDRHVSYCGKLPKPEGVGSEFADVLIRLLDTCDVYGIDLAAEYRRKIEYNRTRPFKHGGRAL